MGIIRFAHWNGKNVADTWLETSRLRAYMSRRSRKARLPQGWWTRTSAAPRAPRLNVLLFQVQMRPVLLFHLYVLELKFFIILHQAHRVCSFDFCDGKTKAKPSQSYIRSAHMGTVMGTNGNKVRKKSAMKNHPPLSNYKL